MNLEQICKQTITIVEQTGQFIYDQLGRVSDSQIMDKDHNSLVSYVDKTAEEQLVERLTSILPQATFITEEETVANEESDLVWIIDPLDGTTNFLHQIPVFSVSVGLQVEGVLKVGVIYEINRKETFYAWRGGGAYLNNRSIRVKSTKILGDTLIATGFPSRHFEYLDTYFSVMQSLMTSTRGLRRLGSAAVDLAYVACGRFDGFFEFGLNPWDIAGGIVIVEEAGGRISDFNGGNDFLFGKQLLASNGSVHEDLLKVIQGGFPL